MQIVVGRSISGEFVVGKLIEKNDKPYLVDVYQLAMHPDEQNPQHLRSIIMPMLAPFTDIAVKEIPVEGYIVAMTVAPDDIERVYVKLTSGLDIVSSGTRIVQ